MLIWNAIVKNEAARIERCVRSLLPHVDGAIIVDTGSSDGTEDLIRQAFAKADKPIEISQAPFENFSQARNNALACARASSLPWQYALLCDADMELVVERPFELNGGIAYDMEQIAGDVRYWNRRILSRTAKAGYRCPTHEYLDVPSAGKIHSAWFIDHADGANRPDKLERDVDLLKAALKTETNEGLIQRMHFYLAQSYFDLRKWKKAAKHYKRRVELGGWDEEVWNAQLHYAHALDNLGDKAGFVWAMLEAYEMRPARAETLYDLAKFFREFGGGNFRSLLFSEEGMYLGRPSDLLFVNDYVYLTGMAEEFAICAYYDPARRDRGAAVCGHLALAPNGTASSREQARNNLYWYLEPLSKHVPSFEPVQIKLAVPDGYVPMNPSVINRSGQLLALVRTVNYRITPEGRYVSRTAELAADGTDIIRTRNFLARLSDHGAVEHQGEILAPVDWPQPQFELVRGFEDSRLFEWNSALWTLSTVRELTQQGWCEQVLAPVVDNGERLCYGAWKRITPAGEKRHEKNWMPWSSEDLNFVYRLGTVIDVTGAVVHKTDPVLAVEHVSGGPQVIAVAPELYLALVHEARFIPGRSTRFYQHRFALMLADGSVAKMSPPFFFHDKQIEFAAGLARFGDRLLISYGVRDEEAWMAWMRLDEVLRFCA